MNKKQDALCRQETLIRDAQKELSLKSPPQPVRVDLMNMIVVIGGSFLGDPLRIYHS